MKLASLLALALVVAAQPPAATQPPAAAAPKRPALQQRAAVVKDHTMTAGGKTLRYKSTTGMMPLKNEAGEIDANLFYVAYTLDPAPNAAQRPLTFCFNGGPGAGSLWLHLGAIGPKRVKMNNDGSMPPAPYDLVDNPSTWLDQSDLVFIDPVGTGWSRARDPETAKKYFGLRGDIESVATVIRQYLDQNARWSSPLYVAGESYGTTRASGMSQYLVDHGISLNGVMLISTIMNFQTARFARANDMPYALFLPTYTAIAGYHKKLGADMPKDVAALVEEARRYAGGEYQQVLYKGDTLTPEERKKAVAQIARLTGLSPQYVDRSDLRIEINRFTQELLRDRGLTVGRLDGRLTGMEGLPLAEDPDFDPSLTAIRPPYTAMMNQYARVDLGWQDDNEYFALGGGITSPWDWGLGGQRGGGGGGQGYADTSENLRNAMEKNPFMKVFIGAGYYDLATPFHAVEYTVNHMQLPAPLKKNFVWSYYTAGHMMYIDVPMLEKLKTDITAFYGASKK